MMTFRACWLKTQIKYKIIYQKSSHLVVAKDSLLLLLLFVNECIHIIKRRFVKTHRNSLVKQPVPLPYLTRQKSSIVPSSYFPWPSYVWQTTHLLTHSSIRQRLCDHLQFATYWTLWGIQSGLGHSPPCMTQACWRWTGSPKSLWMRDPACAAR